MEIAGRLCFTISDLIGYQEYKEHRFRKTAINAMGVVTDFERSESRCDDGRSTTLYTAVIKYMYKGQEYQFTSCVSRRRWLRKVGDSIAVFIEQNDPASARVHSWFFYYRGGIRSDCWPSV